METRLYGTLKSVNDNIKRDENFTDRLNSRYTVVILVVFAVVVTANAYAGNPITCWAPVHFTGSHVKYATSYCWVRNTYYLPLEQDVNVPRKSEARQYVPYYQWIPFILLAQAVLFYFPSMTWHALNSQAGVDADNILESASKLSDCNKVEDHSRTLTFIANQMHRFLKSRRDLATGIVSKVKSCLSYTLCHCCSRRSGSYLLGLYIFCKLLFVANIFFQMFIMNNILGTKYNLYGFEVMKSVIRDHDWTNSPFVAFPRVTLCDFDVRRLGNVHRYTVQCVLPLNLYNEKIYIFLWFWFVFVAVVTCLDVLIWLIRAICKSDRNKFAFDHIQPVTQPEDDEELETFINEYLRQDGVFLLRLIAHNVNGSTATDVGTALWERHKKERQARERKSIDDEEDDEKKRNQIEMNKLLPPGIVKPPAYNPESSTNVAHIDEMKRHPSIEAPQKADGKYV